MTNLDREFDQTGGYTVTFIFLLDSLTCISEHTFNCIQHRKNAVLIRIGVEIVWDNVDCQNGCLECISGIPRIFFCMDGERSWDQDHRTHSLIFDYYYKSKQTLAAISWLFWNKVLNRAILFGLRTLDSSL